MHRRPNRIPPVVRAGVYTRISWEPEGRRAGVERQRVDCEALCAARCWEVTHYFEDNDRSAYSGKKRLSRTGQPGEILIMQFQNLGGGRSCRQGAGWRVARVV